MKTLLKLIKAKMNGYIIQLRIHKIMKNKPLRFSIRSNDMISADFYLIPKENIDQYYDIKTGYKDETVKL